MKLPEIFLGMAYRLTWIALLGLGMPVRADILAGNTPENPLEPAVYSNGCGGDTGVQLISDLVSWLFNTQAFQDSDDNLLAPIYRVNFQPACDLHDAGYAGGVVFDRINGGVVDYRNWGRKQVDDKFLADLQTLCRREVPLREYGPLEWGTKGVALQKCLGQGGALSFGAERYYNTVRQFGADFFDADPATPGKQKSGPRPND